MDIKSQIKKWRDRAKSSFAGVSARARKNLTPRAVTTIGIIVLFALLTVSGGIIKSRQSIELEAQTTGEAAASPEESSTALPLKDDYQDEAETVAKLLYGYQYNSDADLRGICWCVINRCESSKFPSTIQDVCRQERQWMGYSDRNPVIEELYQLALTELRLWHQDGHRPMGGDFVYMEWSTDGITLRTTFEETVKTHYWRPEA